ncbi:MAG TPA: hypothetical protein VFC35_04160 [Gemmatimonadaceae bacterium]|nr:hypothetical protein [Gemmatimonadaceae bacterium]
MKRFFAAAAILLALGCSSAPTRVVTGAPGHRDMLFQAEIEANRSAGMTVYDLIAQLRPEYLRSRGSNSLRDLTPPTAVVYVDNVKYGTLDQLRSMSVEHVSQIQYLSASNATTRFGMDHGGGAILITTR